MRSIKGVIAIAAVALSLSGCGQSKALPHVEPQPSSTAESKPSPPQVPADDERYQMVNQAAEDLDYKSAGKVLKEYRQDGTEIPVRFIVEYEDAQAFQTLHDRIKSVTKVEQCGGSIWKESVTVKCTKDGVIYELKNNKNDTSQPSLQLTDIKQSDRIKEIQRNSKVRTLTKSPSIIGQTTSYNVAGSRIDDLCSWDEGSDGTFEFVEIPCGVHNITQKSKIARMTVVVTDNSGHKIDLHSEITAISPNIVDEILSVPNPFKP